MRLGSHFAIALLFVVPCALSGETPARPADLLPFASDAGVSPRLGLPRMGLPNLILLTRHSGLIFSGTALRVEHFNPEPGTAVASTRITFRVQTAIRGVRRGQVIQIREWDGLWTSGERYQPGERVLLFLYPASRLGLTSPVGGRLGRFRVDNAGRVEVQSPSGSGTRPKPIHLRTFVAEARRAAER